MNSIDIKDMVEEWEKEGLQALAGEEDQKYWKDLCVIEKSVETINN